MPVGSASGRRRILNYDCVEVVGASTSYEKAAHIVPAYLQHQGYEIRPVKPNATAVLGNRLLIQLNST